MEQATDLRNLNVLLPEPLGPANIRNRRISCFIDAFRIFDHESLVLPEINV